MKGRTRSIGSPRVYGFAVMAMMPCIRPAVRGAEWRMAVELEELLVKDAAEWRTWLEHNHDTSPGVWLVLHKKGGSITELDYEAALQEALCFGWIDGQGKRRDDDSSFQRMTRRGPKSVWSARNVDRIEKLEAAGRMTAAGRTAVDAAKADGRWEAAYSGRRRRRSRPILPPRLPPSRGPRPCSTS